jgi:hypothetical protein
MGMYSHEMQNQALAVRVSIMGDVRTLSQSESMQMCIGGAPAIIDRWITS